MSFELQVEFVGVCLNVVHPDTKRVAVLLPDARSRGPYVDGRTAEPHVGYLRYDAAFIDALVPLGNLDDPRTAIVHQLDHEAIDLGLTDDKTAIDTRQLYAPQLEWTDGQKGAARDVELRPGLFGSTPENLLARIILTNGAFTATSDAATWSFSQALRKSGEQFDATITHKEVWKRTLDGNGPFRVGVAKFDGSSSRTIELHPRMTSSGLSVIRLKVANLCAGDPLEWEPFPDPVAPAVDTDFKWVYNLLHSTTTEDLAARLGGSSLPAPRRQHGGASVRNCPGAQINWTF